MITNITLRNFKCFRAVSVFPKLVTVFIGPNGTGKSGVLQSLLLLKQWTDTGPALELEGNLVCLDPKDFLNHGVRSEAPQVDLALAGRWDVSSPDVESPVTFELTLVFDASARFVSRRASAQFDFLGERVVIPDPDSGRPDRLSYSGGSIGYREGVGVGIASLVEAVRVPHGRVSEIREAMQAPRVLLDNMRMVPAIRGFGRRIYPLGIEPRDEISSAAGLSAQEDAMATTMAYSAAEVSRVSDWMKQVTGVGLKAELVPPQSVKPVSTTPLGESSLISEGFGSNTLVQLLFELSRASNGATVLIEEPEIHLHPRAQADLASVIIGEAKAAEKQVIITTHSEHVVGRLLTEVAEGKLSSEEVAIYSFEKDADGVCSASTIEVMETGQVTGGLRSFFQTDLDEMRRYVEALRARA